MDGAKGGETAGLTDLWLLLGQTNCCQKSGEPIDGYSKWLQAIENNQSMRQKWRLVRRYPERQAQTNNHDNDQRNCQGDGITADCRIRSPSRAQSTTCRISGDLSATAPEEHTQL